VLTNDEKEGEEVERASWATPGANRLVIGDLDAQVSRYSLSFVVDDPEDPNADQVECGIITFDTMSVVSLGPIVLRYRACLPPVPRWWWRVCRRQDAGYPYVSNGWREKEKRFLFLRPPV